MKESREVKLLLIILLVAAVAVGIDFFFTLREAGKDHTWEAGPDPSVSRALLIPPGSHMKGDPRAPFSLVVFTDLQCPVCKEMRPKIKALMQKYKGRMNLVSHHLLTQYEHVHAAYLAYATEAADKQGKFWEMRDLIIANQDRFKGAGHEKVRRELIQLARKLNLDGNRFQKDLNGPDVQAAYARDMELVRRVRIYGMPGFFFVPPIGPPIRLKRASQVEEWLNDPAHWK